MNRFLIGVLFGALMISARYVSADDTIYTNYLATAKSKASGLVTLYFGVGNVVEHFQPGPAGTFEVIAKELTSGELTTYYMLSDMQHLIEGRLFSQYSRDIQSAEGIPALQKIINGNVERDRIVSKVTRQATSPIRGNTAASLLELPTQDYSGSDSKSASQPFLDIPNSKKSLYESLHDLHFAQLGNGKEVVYMFVDNNCGGCAQMHEHIKAMEIPTNVSIRFITVGFINKDSEHKASYLLSINEPSLRYEAMDKLMVNAPLEKLIKADPNREKVQVGWNRYKENTLAFFKLEKPQTPYVVANVNGSYIASPMTSPNTLKKVFTQLQKNDADLQQDTPAGI